MNNHLNEKILASIKNQDLHPRPRWQFILRNALFWGGTVVLTAIGSIAIATGVFIINDHDWDVFVYLDKSRLVYTLEVLPYLWLVILIVSSILARYSVTHTRTGYRYRVRTIIGASVAISTLLGVLLYFAGFGTMIHETLNDQIPWYEHLVYTKKDAWYAPEKGLLSGDIVSVTDTAITVRAVDTSTWFITALPEVRELPELAPGLRIKLIGEQTAEQTFNAEDIELWND